MQKITVLLGLLLAVLLVACEPGLSAQDESDLIVIENAFVNLTNQNSVRTAGNMGMNMNMSLDTGMAAVGTIEVRSFYTMTFEGMTEYNGNVATAVDATLKLDGYADAGSLGGNTQGGFTSDLLMQDGQSWVRIRSSTGSMSDLGTTNWQLGAAGSVGNSIDASDITGLIDINRIAFPITPQTVKSLTRLNPRTLNGQLTNGYRLEFDISNIFDEMDDSGLLNSFDLTAATGLNMGTLEDFFDNMTYSMDVYIGQDNLIHAMNMDMRMRFNVREQGMDAEAVMDMNASIIYSEFNTPVDIQLPQ